MEDLIKYENVSIGYDNKIILDKINFSLKPKEFVFLTGKVGVGKTTFLKSIYGEIKIKEGSATVLNFNLKKIKFWKIHKLRRQIGYIFQDFSFLNDRTVFDNLEFVLKATGWNNDKEIKNRIDFLLNDVELSDKANAKPYELSTGERQRLAISRALSNNPRIILADEPTANLDIEAANYVLNKLYDISKKSASVILISHDLTIMTQFPVKTVIIENKKLKTLNTMKIFE